MAQRSIEMLIGRLITDEVFRSEFSRDRLQALQNFVDAGHELTSLEMAAVLATPCALWNEVAERLDPRLQKAGLTRRPHP